MLDGFGTLHMANTDAAPPPAQHRRAVYWRTDLLTYLQACGELLLGQVATDLLTCSLSYLLTYLLTYLYRVYLLTCRPAASCSSVKERRFAEASLAPRAGPW